MTDAFDPIDFLERAVATPSHEDVGPMRTLLVETIDAALDRSGPDPVTGPHVDGAGNVVASRGAGSPHLVLNTHLDTVPPHVPFEREAVDGEDWIHGRGACDPKGSLAAMVGAFLDADATPGRLTLAVTPDEETASSGAAALVDDPDGPFGAVGGTGAPDGASMAAPDGVIVGEPTGLNVCVAARGRFQGTVRLRGESAHAAEPDNGRNAVAAAARALDAFETFDAEHGPGIDKRLGPPDLTATRIAGGEAANQVPAECTITFDRRSIPPESAAGFRTSFEHHVEAAVPDDIGVTVAFTPRDTPWLEAFTTDEADPLVTTLRDASGGAVRPFDAATEASYFAALVPTVVFGPGELVDADGPVAHADREYVPVESVRAAHRALSTMIDRFETG